MAREVLRFRDSALRRRAAALRRAPVIVTSRAVSPQLIRAAGGPERAGVLVAEGDSWFDYPWHDVLRMLEDHHGFDVESVAHKGDSIESMAYNGQLEELTRTIEKLLRQGVIHGYGRPVPDGRGVLGGWGPLPGPWLQPGFRDKGFGTLTTCVEMAADLIDRFNAMLRRLVALPEFGHVRYVDVRDDLSNGADYRTWWANELHPTRRGFEVVAERFASVI